MVDRTIRDVIEKIRSITANSCLSNKCHGCSGINDELEVIIKDLLKQPEKQNEPQLSAEMEKKVDKADFYVYGPLGMGIDTKKLKHFLATALEEQRLGYIEQMNKLMTVRVMDDRFLDTPFLYKSDVIAILTKKEQ